MSAGTWLKTFDWSSDHPLDPAVVHPAATDADDDVPAAAKNSKNKKGRDTKQASAMASALLSAAKAAADAVVSDAGEEGAKAEDNPGPKKKKKKGEPTVEAGGFESQPDLATQVSSKIAASPSKRGVPSPSKKKATAGEGPSGSGKEVRSVLLQTTLFWDRGGLPLLVS